MTRQYTDFTLRILSVIRKIPHGRVISYGGAAALAGNPRGARQVARILSSMSQSQDLPWFRVLGADGSIRLPGAAGELQRSLLESEGVVAVGGKIDLAAHGWDGS